MKKILFLHGFFATGSCPMAVALKEAFENHTSVLTPDLPLHPKEALKQVRSIIEQDHPKEALKQVRSIIEQESPDLLLGNSCGSFLAQILAPIVGIPALLGNPHFEMTKFLKERIGEHQYKAPRKDGNQTLVIDEALIEEFAELEKIQLKRFSLTAVIRITETVSGDYSANRTDWLTMSPCSWDITTIPIISRVRILLQNRK